jgi:peptidyl-prolyl cis-trans isomerase C
MIDQDGRETVAEIVLACNSKPKGEIQMNLLRAALLLIGLAMIYLTACSGKNDEQSAAAFPDSIVDTQLIATVNSYDIRGRELRTFSAMFGMGPQEGLSKSEYNEQVLDEFIRRILLWKEAVVLGIAVDDSTSQAIFRDFEQSIGGEEILNQRLEESQIGRGDLIQSIRRDMVIRQYLETYFAEESAVDSSEVVAYYEQNKERFASPDSVRARHILLQIHEDDDDTIRQDKRKRIEEILLEAKSGADFALLAQQHSEGPSNVRGGDLGFFHKGTMVQPFDSAAFALKVGEISGVVETKYGYHIIKVEEKRDGRLIKFGDVQDQLITQMKQQKLAMAVQNHLNQMMNLANIERHYMP